MRASDWLINKGFLFFIPEHSPGVAGGLVALGVYGSEKKINLDKRFLITLKPLAMLDFIDHSSNFVHGSFIVSVY